MRTLPTLNIFVSSFVLLSLHNSDVCWNLLVCSFCFVQQPSLVKQIRKQVQASKPKLTESLCC